MTCPQRSPPAWPLPAAGRSESAAGQNERLIKMQARASWSPLSGRTNRRSREHVPGSDGASPRPAWIAPSPAAGRMESGEWWNEGPSLSREAKPPAILVASGARGPSAVSRAHLVTGDGVFLWARAHRPLPCHGTHGKRAGRNERPVWKRARAILGASVGPGPSAVSGSRSVGSDGGFLRAPVDYRCATRRTESGAGQNERLVMMRARASWSPQADGPHRPSPDHAPVPATGGTPSTTSDNAPSQRGERKSFKQRRDAPPECPRYGAERSGA